MSKQPIYQVTALKHRYGEQVVLDIESLQIESGAIVGLAGPNGSGKSTLLRLLGFIAKPTEGKIYFRGSEAEPFADTVRFKVTLLSQYPYLMKRTVYRNIAYGLQLRGRTHDLKQNIHQALEQVGLEAESFSGRQWNELSGGEAQRVALAARLALKPDVLLLDEPTANVDIHSSQLIKSAAVNVRKQHGATLIVASHDREWLDEVCDHVICLFKGRITGKDRDNIVFGPWQVVSNGHCVKRLSDGQEIVISNPVDYPAAASIDPDLLIMTPKELKPHASESCLDGTITRLTMGCSNDRMIVSLRVGELSLAVRVESRLIERQNLYPGRVVRVEIPAAAVNWIPL